MKICVRVCLVTSGGSPVYMYSRIHIKFTPNMYLNSYAGDHYSLTQLGQVSLHLNYTDDGLVWKPIGNSPFYIGGISEVGE